MTTLKNNTSSRITVVVLSGGAWVTLRIAARGVLTGEFTQVDATTKAMISRGEVLVLSGSVTGSGGTPSTPTTADQPIGRQEAERRFVDNAEMDRALAAYVERFLAIVNRREKNEVTEREGGGYDAVDGIPTANGAWATGEVVRTRSGLLGAREEYALEDGDEDHNPDEGIIWPADRDSITNNRFWRRIL